MILIESVKCLSDIVLEVRQPYPTRYVVYVMSTGWLLAHDLFDIANICCSEILLRDNSKICKKISPR